MRIKLVTTLILKPNGAVIMSLRSPFSMTVWIPADYVVDVM